MGAFTVFSSWFVFLLFIRRLPGLGIYVVMVVEIMKTFGKFFIVFFLFIVAFAMSFHLLIQNQVNMVISQIGVIVIINMLLAK